MTTPSASKITQLLQAWSEGDETALEKLIPLVEQELRRLAHQYLQSERPGHLLQTDALINEVYLRLVNVKPEKFEQRADFYALSAHLMRNILVDFFRRSPGKIHQVSLDEALTISRDRPADLVALDDALRDLAAFDQRKSQVVELRYFGGMSVEETAAALKISRQTVIRDWNAAKAWLYRALRKGER